MGSNPKIMITFGIVTGVSLQIGFIPGRRFYAGGTGENFNVHGKAAICRRRLAFGLPACRGKSMKTVTIYTDGACSGNPGPGGWGAILQYGPHTKEISGGEDHTTNNRMELMGVISALRLLKEPCIVELYSDSKYVIDALEKGWARGWKARGWVKSDKKPALNPDLWEELLGLCDVHTVRTHWVKGHSTNPYNNRCDELAVEESRRHK